MLKAIKSILVLAIPLLISFCSTKTDKKVVHNPRAIKSWEWDGMDTINRTDFSNDKQGHWKEMDFIASDQTVQAVYTGEPGVQTKILKNYVERLKIEEGDYINGKREGFWRRFYPSGRLKDSAVYKNNVVINDFSKN